MKKIMMAGTLFLFTLILLLNQSTVSAQGMMGYFNSSTNSATIQSQQQEELEGKQFLDGLKNKTVICLQLSDADFEKIGEYFMGQSIGNTQRHIAMNGMMKWMMGEKGEEQAHQSMGKRLSGCDASAQVPLSRIGFMPIMGYMMGYGGWGGFGLGWIFMIVFWILIILGVVALVRYLGGTKQNGVGKKPLNILKERYVKGEINKKEFEEMKKELQL